VENTNQKDEETGDDQEAVQGQDYITLQQNEDDTPGSSKPGGSPVITSQPQAKAAGSGVGSSEPIALPYPYPAPNTTSPVKDESTPIVQQPNERTSLKSPTPPGGTTLMYTDETK